MRERREGKGKEDIGRERGKAIFFKQVEEGILKQNEDAASKEVWAGTGKAVWESATPHISPLLCFKPSCFSSPHCYNFSPKHPPLIPGCLRQPPKQFLGFTLNPYTAFSTQKQQWHVLKTFSLCSQQSHSLSGSFSLVICLGSSSPFLPLFL